jgi:hypothetical protein
VEGGERGPFCVWEEVDIVGLVAGRIRLVRGVDMSAPEFIENGFEMSFSCQRWALWRGFGCSRAPG